MQELSSFDGPVWRILPASSASFPATPASAPAGRFHHSNQIAAYCSLTAEGAGVAIRRYLDDGVPRVLVPVWLTARSVADARANPTASIVWQDIWATGTPSPTWEISDGARSRGAEAMLYSSRSRPDLGHVVVFSPDCLCRVGPVTPFVAWRHDRSHDPARKQNP